ncbi:MAG: hypothetical protein R6U46_12290 [Marinilabilia sp.]
MKQLLLTLFLATSLFASSQSKVETVTTWLEEIINFEDANFNDHNPILTVNSLAAEQADEVEQLTESNIAEVFEKAMDFSHCLITVDQHTIVLVKDWENCSQSGAWEVCMPFGEGYILSGEMEKHEDHINNIIGTPDASRRTVFLFE